MAGARRTAGRGGPAVPRQVVPGCGDALWAGRRQPPAARALPVSARSRPLHLLEVELAWPPEDYIRCKLEGLAAEGLRVTVAADAGRRDRAASISGVALIRLPRPDEP